MYAWATHELSTFLLCLCDIHRSPISPSTFVQTLQKANGIPMNTIEYHSLSFSTIGPLSGNSIGLSRTVNGNLKYHSIPLNGTKNLKCHSDTIQIPLATVHTSTIQIVQIGHRHAVDNLPERYTPSRAVHRRVTRTHSRSVCHWAVTVHWRRHSSLAPICPRGHCHRGYIVIIVTK